MTKNLESAFTSKRINFVGSFFANNTLSIDLLEKTDDDLMILMQKLKEKFAKSDSYKDQIQILTPKPNS